MPQNLIDEKLGVSKAKIKLSAANDSGVFLFPKIYVDITLETC